MPKPLKEPWKFLDHYRLEGAGPVHLTERWPTVPDRFRITAHRFPEHAAFTAFEPEHLALTYSEALHKVEITAAYLAVLFAGAIVVPIDYQLNDQEITGLLEFSGTEVLFVDNERNRTYEPVRRSPSDCAAILCTSGTTGDPKGVMLSHDNLVSDCFPAQCNLYVGHDTAWSAVS